MTTPLPPSCQDLIESDHVIDADSEIVLVQSEADPTWRHGCYMAEVFLRVSDSTYWMACYCRSSDGETNELHDGSATISRVYPHIVQTTVYRSSP